MTVSIKAGSFQISFVQFARNELIRILDNPNSLSHDKAYAIEQLILAVIEERTGS